MFSNSLVIVVFVCWHFRQVSAQQNHLVREKRTLYLPPSDAVQISAALTIPLDNGRGDVFFSLCVGSNYNHPTYSVESISLDPPLFAPLLYATEEARKLKVGADMLTSATTMPPNEQKNEIVNVNDDLIETANKNPVIKRRMRNSFISRKKFYKMIENKMFQHGLNAKKCLLRAICEANLYELGAHNGILGDFVHIMFSPTTSKDENLPKKYYVAELKGRNGESCETAYGKDCTNGIFDLITIIK